VKSYSCIRDSGNDQSLRAPNSERSRLILSCVLVKIVF